MLLRRLEDRRNVVSSWLLLFVFAMRCEEGRIRDTRAGGAVMEERVGESIFCIEKCVDGSSTFAQIEFIMVSGCALIRR